MASLIAGLILNEAVDISPWMAKRIVARAARLWSDDPVRQQTYAEEWAAIIEERPGKLFKLLTALNFYQHAAMSRVLDRLDRLATRWWSPVRGFLFRFFLPTLAVNVIVTLSTGSWPVGFLVTLGLSVVGSAVGLVLRGLRRRRQHRRRSMWS